MKNIIIATLFVFAFLTQANNSKVLAVYGSDIILEETPPEEHVVVDAGIEDVALQLSLMSITFAGMISSTILFKKLK